MLEQSAAQYAFRRQSVPAGLTHSLSPQVTRNRDIPVSRALQPAPSGVAWINGSSGALRTLDQAAFTAPEPFEVAKRDLSGAKVVGAQDRLGKQGCMAPVHRH